MPFPFPLMPHRPSTHRPKPETFSIERIWKFAKRHKQSKEKGTNNADGDELFAKAVVAEIRLWTRSDVSNRVDCEEAIGKLRQKMRAKLHDETKKARNRLLLLETVKMMAEYRLNNRALVRDVLGDLLRMSSHIDREILMFEHASLDSPYKQLTAEEHASLVERQDYIMSQVSGWKLPSDLTWLRVGDVMTYLEMPIKRASGTGSTNHLLSEAIYRQHSPPLVLLLLRYGVLPSCIYLWPLCIIIDSRLPIPSDFASDTSAEPVNLGDEIRESDEAQILRYFCRARTSIRMHYVRGPHDHDSVGNLPHNVSYDDVLVIPTRIAELIPGDRHKKPPLLAHLCRIVIRQLLLGKDKLPEGIDQLPLPKAMKNYVDLRCD